VSLPRLVIAFITVGLLALLTMPLTEGLLKLHGASLIIFVAGTFTIIGGALGLWGAIRNNAEQADLILGDKDTFCQLIVYHDAAVGWYLSTYHAGSGGAITAYRSPSVRFATMARQCISESGACSAPSPPRRGHGIFWYWVSVPRCLQTASSIRHLDTSRPR
jgi:hypothetical protein